jgi:predicted transcriptional regulator
MDPIDEAIAAIESLQLGERLSYRKAADRFSVNYTTLLRRHKEC